MARELAASIQKGGGLITADDLAHYEVKEREPIRGTYRGYEIISAPPPSSGGIALLEILNILEGYDLAKAGDRSAAVGPFDGRGLPACVLMIEPNSWVIPDFSKIPVAQLIDKKYGAAWRESIDPAHASVSKDLKRPAIFSELEQYASQHPQPLVCARTRTHHALFCSGFRRKCSGCNHHVE